MIKPAGPLRHHGLVRYESNDAVLERFGKFWRDPTRSDLVLEMYVTDDQVNPLGLLHGGVMLAVLDVLLVDAARQFDAQHRAFVTVSMSVEFMRTAHEGDWLEYHSHVERIGGSLAFMTGRILRSNACVTRVSAVLKAMKNR